MLIFYFFAALVVLQSLASLRGGVRWLAFFRREFDGETAARTTFVVAGRAVECGQKVHNLRAAVAVCDTSSEVFVFVDTDARPRADWLRSLVAPLADRAAGAATGYRWFLPVSGGLASHLRSVWNASIASALGADVRRNFCWGGSTAIRRATFEKLNMRERWRGAASDDYALTRALREEGLPIRFAPACLTASPEDCSFGALLEFTTRQLKITRVYAPNLWRIVLASNALFLYNALAAAFSRRIVWRGIEYELKSPTETAIIEPISDCGFRIAD